MPKWARKSIVIGLVWGLGYTAGTEFGQDEQPFCPTEDSCAVETDYRDGTWQIDVFEIVP